MDVILEALRIGRQYAAQNLDFCEQSLTEKPHDINRESLDDARAEVALFDAAIEVAEDETGERVVVHFEN